MTSYCRKGNLFIVTYSDGSTEAFEMESLAMWACASNNLGDSGLYECRH